MKFRPYGLAGGEPASAARNALQTAAGTKELPSKTTGWLKSGDLVIHEQPGGGGFGDPLAREPERVAADVWNGKITAEYAARHHAVVVDPRTGALDEAATQALRARRARAAA
jgi:N-methylhydantoinase B